MSNGLERMLKEQIVAYLQVLPRHLHRRSEENHERCLLIKPVSGPKFVTWTSRQEEGVLTTGKSDDTHTRARVR